MARAWRRSSSFARRSSATASASSSRRIPTFSLAKNLQQILIALAIGVGRDGGALDEPARQALIEEASRSEHRPDQPLDLAEEHRQSVAAIGNLHAVLDQVYDLAFCVAEEAYPDRWTEINPRLVTIASWVGYDLDGRSDIPWTTTFAKRLRVQTLQLERYHAAAGRLRAMVEGSGGLGDILELLEARLALAIKQAGDEIAVFETDAAPRRCALAPRSSRRSRAPCTRAGTRGSSRSSR